MENILNIKFLAVRRQVEDWRVTTQNNDSEVCESLQVIEWIMEGG